MSDAPRAGCRGCAIVEAGACAEPLASKLAAWIAAHGLRALVIDAGGAAAKDASARRSIAEVRALPRALGAEALRGYLARGKPALGAVSAGGAALAEEELARLADAYDVMLLVLPFDPEGGELFGGCSPLLARFAGVPALIAVRPSDSGAVAAAGRGIEWLLSAQQAPRPVAFVLSEGDLLLASRLARLWRVPSWGDDQALEKLAERLLERALPVAPRGAAGTSAAAAPGSSDGGGRGAADAVREVLRALRQDRAMGDLLRTAPGGGKDARHSARERVAAAARRAALLLPREELGELDVEQVVARAVDEAVGFGPLTPLLADPAVTEVMVSGASRIYVEREGRIERVPNRFEDDAHLLAVIERMVAPVGRRIDEAQPSVDARLADGSRVHAIIPPLALDGPALTIRRFGRRLAHLDEAVAAGMLPREVAAFLAGCVRARASIVVSGGTGAGKTTLLNMLAAAIDPCERIVTIEDAAELAIALPHVVRLEARPPNIEGAGAVTIRELVRNALRMRPDRIVVGECRGPEALDMLQAMNTGHEGSLTTVHANGARDALSRLETMVLMAGVTLPLAAVREQIARAITLVIQVERARDGVRRVTEVAEVTGMEGNVISMQHLATMESGVLRATGLHPRCGGSLPTADGST